MRHFILSVFLGFSSASMGVAQPVADLTAAAVNDLILPGYTHLAEASRTLADTAQSECDRTSPALLAAYGDAFDAWISVSHLRFGPSERDDRAYALAFWPDSRGVTPKTLSGLIAAQDTIIDQPENYGDVSIAARGFYALEFLLYDDTIAALGSDEYRCQLVRTMTADIAGLADAINEDWHQGYGDQLVNTGPESAYRTPQESAQALFKTLITGLDFMADTRLERPLGTFDRPRPARAEAWRSGRSARHVALSLAALRDLAILLAGDDSDLSAALIAAFDKAQQRVESLNDPVFAGVMDPNGRFAVEVLQQSVRDIRTIVTGRLGPELGVAAGFNALDGD